MNNPYSAPQAQLVEPVSNETYMPKLFSATGRIGRVRYLGYSAAIGMLSMLVMIILMAVAGIFAAGGGTGAAAGIGILGVIVMIAFYIVSFAATFILAKRRLNDLGKTGWLSLLILVPLVNLFLVLWFVFGRGDEQANEYGPAPAPNTTGVIILAWSLLVYVIVIVGVMAAVAIPAYADYTKRAQAAQMTQGLGE